MGRTVLIDPAFSAAITEMGTAAVIIVPTANALIQFSSNVSDLSYLPLLKIGYSSILRMIIFIR